MTARTVPAAEANREFSKLLRAARDGQRIVITSHGEPVAELGPVNGKMRDEARRARAKAHRALMRHLEAQPFRVVGAWSREEIYGSRLK